MVIILVGLINFQYSCNLAECYPNEKELSEENLRVRRRQLQDGQEPINTLITDSMVSDFIMIVKLEKVSCF